MSRTVTINACRTFTNAYVSRPGYLAVTYVAASYNATTSILTDYPPATIGSATSGNLAEIACPGGSSLATNETSLWSQILTQESLVSGTDHVYASDGVTVLA